MIIFSLTNYSIEVIYSTKADLFIKFTGDLEMLIDCSLDALKEFFDKETVASSIQKGSGEFAMDYLVIDMGKDEKGRPQLIDVFAIQKDIPEQDSEEIMGLEPKKKKKENKPNFLHIQYFIPFQFRGGAVNEIARFLLLINKTLEFTGFGMSEVDHLVYFRHDLFCDRSKVNTELLKGLLGYLLLMVDSFTPTIESLGLQETTFQEVIKKSLGQE